VRPAGTSARFGVHFWLCGKLVRSHIPPASQPRVKGRNLISFFRSKRDREGGAAPATVWLHMRWDPQESKGREFAAQQRFGKAAVVAGGGKTRRPSIYDRGVKKSTQQEKGWGKKKRKKQGKRGYLNAKLSIAVPTSTGGEVRSNEEKTQTRNRNSNHKFQKKVARGGGLT